MNPKKMTNEELAEYPRDFTSQDLLSATVEDIQNQPFSSRCKAECDELLRRLNEADALRKENAVIRADNADLLAKQDAFVFVHNNMTSDMDALRKENEELKEKIYFFARTFRYYAGEAFRFYEKHPLARETDETRAANTTKEGEASHDR